MDEANKEPHSVAITARCEPLSLAAATTNLTLFSPATFFAVKQQKARLDPMNTDPTRLPLMMEVEGVVLECGIMVFGLLRNLLFDVCELWRWSV